MVYVAAGVFAFVVLLVMLSRYDSKRAATSAARAKQALEVQRATQRFNQARERSRSLTDRAALLRVLNSAPDADD